MTEIGHFAALQIIKWGYFLFDLDFSEKSVYKWYIKPIDNRISKLYIPQIINLNDAWGFFCCKVFLHFGKPRRLNQNSFQSAISNNLLITITHY